MQSKKFVNTPFNILTIPDDFSLRFGELEIKPTHKYIRVFRGDIKDRDVPLYMRQDEQFVQFGFGPDTRPGNTRAKYGLATKIDEKNPAVVRGFDILNKAIRQAAWEKKELIFEDSDEITKEIFMSRIRTLGSTKRKKDKKNPGKTFDPTLSLKAIMKENQETKELEPDVLVIDMNKQKHKPEELVYGSIASVIWRLSHFWIASNAGNCTAQIKKIACSQFGREEEEEFKFDFEMEEEGEGNVDGNDVDLSFGNSDMSLYVPPSAPTPNTEGLAPMERNPSPGKRKAESDGNSRSKKRQRTK